MKFQKSEIIALKETASDEIEKEIVAFANSYGGRLYVGISNEGTVLGLKDADEASLQICSVVQDALKPDLRAFIRCKTLTAEGKQIVEVHVRQGTESPYFIAEKGISPSGVYVRQGYSSVPATNPAIRQMVKETDGDHFEDMRSLDQKLTFQKGEKEFAVRNMAFGSAQMKTLGLMTRDGIYTNLGLLLSDQCPCTIKAAVFAGAKPEAIQHRREFSGSLLQQMEDAFHFIDLCNQIHSSFEGLRRMDQRDYPKTAVREALFNLLIHRDYSIRASSLITLYSNRIEFTSIGGLAEGMTQKDMESGINSSTLRLRHCANGNRKV